MAKIEFNYKKYPRVNIDDFMREHELKLEITNYKPRQNRITVMFSGKDCLGEPDKMSSLTDGVVMVGVYGNGVTLLEAIKHYAERISRGTLMLGWPHVVGNKVITPARTIEVPILEVPEGLELPDDY